MGHEAIIDGLKILNSHNLLEYQGDLNELLTKNIESTLTQLQINDEVIDLTELKPYYIDNSKVWKYICLSSYLFKELGETLEDDKNLLSVQQNKLLQKALGNYINIGISSNLLPSMAAYKKNDNLSIPCDENQIINQYKTLAGTTSFTINILKYPKLRLNILTNFSKPLLNALYQIIYCPLKKPSNESSCNFVMSEEIYKWLLEDKEKFKNSFNYVINLFNKKIYVHCTMMLVNPKSPKWLKFAVSKTLDNILTGPQGIQMTLWSMLEYKVDSVATNDRARNWETLDILTKLILNFYNKPEFDGLCNQLVDLLKKVDDSKHITTFEDLYCLCLKKLYLMNKELCKEKLLTPIFNQLKCFFDDTKFIDNDDITIDVEHPIRLIFNCFIGRSLRTTDLPITLLKPYLNVFFNLYTVTLDSSHPWLKNQLQDILLKYMKNTDCSSVFDNFLFDLQPNEMILMRKDIFIETQAKSLFVKVPQNKTKTNIGRKSDVLIRLCRKHEYLYTSLFMYYLKTLQEKEKYFKLSTNKDLLQLEDELILDEETERKLTVYQGLSALAEDVLIQDYINENPGVITQFLKDMLINLMKSNVHKSMDYDSDEFQNGFTTIMILQALVTNATKENLNHYKTLSEIIHTLFCESLNLELKHLLKTVGDVLYHDNFKLKRTKPPEKSEVDKALDDVCDRLLPVRGHGLLVLRRLVEKKDLEAMERKNYIFNIFHQHLKDKDSFIYLAAIGGLAAMGDIFPDFVIKILTEEYSDFSKKNEEDGIELRMKLGEILVKVTRSLGDMAPKYKSFLLNAFLAGTKDEDHLIRASSLSNLGEICKVLGYKLGSIVTEVLVCVHSIIATDKAVEARRAAVTVIRQLLAGLEAEMVVFLKDHILEIYKTLKIIYNNDKDDVMRLQAQLALEELNENVKDFVFPKPTLNTEKKIIMLN